MPIFESIVAAPHEIRDASSKLTDTRPKTQSSGLLERLCERPLAAQAMRFARICDS